MKVNVKSLLMLVLMHYFLSAAHTKKQGVRGGHTHKILSPTLRADFTSKLGH